MFPRYVHIVDTAALSMLYCKAELFLECTKGDGISTVVNGPFDVGCSSVDNEFVRSSHNHLALVLVQTCGRIIDRIVDCCH